MSSATKHLQWGIWVLLALAAVYGLYCAISLAWVCDDAFISFRYAKNLADGHGLVYNVGERVEGYTNFLWTVMIAGGMMIGIDPVVLTETAGIIGFALTALIFLYLSVRLTRNLQQRRLLIVPLTAAALLVHYDFEVWATSGLETIWAAVLVALGFVILVLHNDAKGTRAAGLVLVIAMLLRPDSVIFFAAGLPYLLLRPSDRRIHLTNYLIPLLLIFVPYWMIRYAYYGYIFPNTFYAKSVSMSYYTQGLTFIWLYFKTYYAFLLVLPAMALTFRLLAPVIWSKRSLDDPADRALTLGVLMTVPYLLFVLRLGGGFMFARLLIPVTPILLVLIEASLLKYIRRDTWRLGIAVAIVAAVLLRWNQFGTHGSYIKGIANERDYYPPGVVDQARSEGTFLKQVFEGFDVRVGFVGGRAMLIYYSEIPVAIECHTGLTDEYIAHLPLIERGRPGHEKNAPIDYLVRRKVNFAFTPPRETEGTVNIRAIRFGDIPAEIITYDRQVMDALKAYPEIAFVDFPAHLDQYLANIASVSPDQRDRDLQFFQQYYFSHNQDNERWAALTEAPPEQVRRTSAKLE